MKIRVGIFFGGRSVEHEVSVISAAQTAAAMDAGKYEVVPIYITKDNEMYTGPDLFSPRRYRDLPALLAASRRVALVRDKGKVWLMRYPARWFGKSVITQLDVAFPVIHGTNGEDGSLQGLLQLHGLPYVGSDVGASANGMDKWTAKCLLERAGLPVLPGCCFRSAQYDTDADSVIHMLEGFRPYPLMVKPVNLGSSVGISPAHTRDELADSIELASSFAERILVEPMLVGMREINCAVLGDADGSEASACEEPLSTGEILSYHDKYQAGGNRKAGMPGTQATARSADAAGAAATEGGRQNRAGGPAADGMVRVGQKGGVKGMDSALRKIPADLDKGKEEEIKDLAQQAFAALGCSGVVRVDFLLDQEDGGKVYINEINTIPGSLAFYLWEAAGKPFGQLTDELVRLALKRSRILEKLIWSNTVNLLAGLPVGAKGAKGAMRQ